MNHRNFICITATLPQHFNDGKILFREYAGALPFMLNFQDLDHEIANLSTMYAAPEGALLLVYTNNTPIGCTGVRKLDSETAELKRMFVQSKYRGTKNWAAINAIGFTSG